MTHEPRWRAPIGGDVEPLGIVAEIWKRRQTWEKRYTKPDPNVETFVPWEQVHPCRVADAKLLPPTLFDAIWQHAGRAVVLYWSVSTEAKEVCVHGLVLPHHELSLRLYSRWEEPVLWHERPLRTHASTPALMRSPGFGDVTFTVASGAGRVLGDIDYDRPLAINRDAAVAWMQRLHEVDEHTTLLDPNASPPKQFRSTLRWLGDGDAASGRAMSFLIRLVAIDAERRGGPEWSDAARYLLWMHVALWRRYQQLYYGNDEATLLREVVAPAGLAADASVRCYERRSEDDVNLDFREIYYRPSVEKETEFRPKDEPFSMELELRRFVRSYPAAPLPTRFYVVPAAMLHPHVDADHSAAAVVLLHYRDVWYWAMRASLERLRFAIDSDVTVDEWLARYISSPSAWNEIRFAIWDSLRQFGGAAVPWAQLPIDSLPRGSGRHSSGGAITGDFSQDPYMSAIESTTERIDAEAVIRDLDRYVYEFTTHLMDGVGPARTVGPRIEWGEHGGPLTIHLDSTPHGWNDFKNGAFGKLLWLPEHRRGFKARAHARNVSESNLSSVLFLWCLRYARAFLDDRSSKAPPQTTSVAPRMMPEQRTEIARRVWADCEPLATMAETDERRQRVDAYLCGLRMIRCWPELVRSTRWRYSERYYVANAGRFPAIVCPLYLTTAAVAPTDMPQAVHGLLLSSWSEGRTALLANSKRTIGTLGGSAIPVGGDPSTATRIMLG